MNIANSTGVSAAVNSAASSDLGTVQGAASTLVLKKALEVQAQGAIALLNALPQQPALATQGSLGRNLNVFA
ncbi:MAG TPA: YjfB family protein [Roseateles sp.]|nr:YjfB family protein [Roseateles sp.]